MSGTGAVYPTPGKPASKAASAGAQAKLPPPAQKGFEGPCSALAPVLGSSGTERAAPGDVSASSVPALQPSLRTNQGSAAAARPSVPIAKEMPAGSNAEPRATKASGSLQNTMLAGAALAPRPLYRLGLKRPSKPLHANVNRPA